MIGGTKPAGGKAEIFLDGIRQFGLIDFNTPAAMHHQVLYRRNGLASGPHQLKIGPMAGDETMIDGIQYSAATGDNGFGEGGGPKEPQRMIFGYTGRKDYIDSNGDAWRPGVEFIARTAKAVDPVARTWWTMARQEPRLITKTPDPEVYLYGIHGPEFTINVTVGPGPYYARLKLAETEFTAAGKRVMAVFINGEAKMANLDIYARAGGAGKALDLVFNNIRPKNGIVEVRLRAMPRGGGTADAILQALEVGPQAAVAMRR